MNEIKRGFVFFLMFILVLSLCLGADTTNPDEDKTKTTTTTDPNLNVPDIVKQFSENMGDKVLGQELSKKLNGMTDKQKTEFFNEVAKKTGVTSLKNLGSKVKEFDSNGNIVLSSGGKISLSKLYNYAIDTNSGSKRDYSYEFRDAEYKVDSPKIKDVKVDGDKVIYDFDNKASLEVKGDATFDFDSRKILVGDKGIEWANMDGNVKVDGKTIGLDVRYDPKGESDLKSFPILKDESGKVSSPFHEIVNDVKLPKDFKKPDAGKFKIMEQNGKKYSVDSTGIVRELKSSSVTMDEKGNFASASDAMVGIKDTGDFFTKKDTTFPSGDTVPTEKSKNFIWISDKEGKKFVMINSVGEGKMYFHQSSNLESLELSGESVVKNGDLLIVADSKGNIKVRKIEKTKGEMKYTVEKFFTSSKKDEVFKIQVYEGDNKAFKGKILILTTDGKIAMLGGSVSIANVKILEKMRGGSTGNDLLNELISYIPEGLYNPGFFMGEGSMEGKAHYATHQLHSALRNKYGEGFASAAMYLLNGEYAVINNPKGITMKDLADYVSKNGLSGGADSTYLQKSQGEWNEQPLTHIFDEWGAYLTAASVGADVGDRNSNLQVEYMMNFVGYNVAMLDLVKEKEGESAYYKELKGIVQKQIKNSMDVYQKSKVAGTSSGASSYINKLASNQAFSNALSKHFGTDSISGIVA